MAAASSAAAWSPLAGHIAAIAALAGIERVEIREVPPRELVERGFQLFAFPYLAAGGQLGMEGAAKALGLTPRPYAEAIADTVGALLARQPAQAPSWPGRASTQSRLCGTHEWLHWARETGPDPSAALANTGVDGILAHLLGKPSPATAGWSVRSLAAYSNPQGMAPHGPLILAPAALLARWGAGGAPDGSGAAPGPLMAVIEAAQPGQPDHWLYLQHRAPLRQRYAEGCGAVYRLLTRGFSDLEPGTARQRERIVAECRLPQDIAALHRWLDERRQTRILHVEDLACWARVHLAPSCHLAAPGDGLWLDVCAVARLLVASGREGAADLHLFGDWPRQSAPGQRRGVFFADEQACYLADIDGGHLYTVDSPAGLPCPAGQAVPAHP
ncbi:hypothetical protein [Massilia scottii]|uniref:hypothetical protein n=1 Tax=Massilia scottii TaxID=3057166 RepID=UPI0027969A15|nr:hypothetical protein [Massilia sp. CCM 9029]MDQ1833618.1 hypothetical protein [Massilia sp. CCM 9029]